MILGSRGARLSFCLVGEGAEVFNNSLDKLHKLMKRWDELPPLRPGFVWKDEPNLAGRIRVTDNQRIESPVVAVQLNDWRSHAHHVGNQRLMFVANIKIVNDTEKVVLAVHSGEIPPARLPGFVRENHIKVVRWRDLAKELKLPK